MTKNIPSTLFLILLILTGFAQDTDTKLTRHEFGLNVYSFSNAYMYRANDTFDNEYFPQHGYLNGVMYKFHFKKSALRVSFTYTKKDFPDFPSYENMEVGKYYSGSVWNKELRVGYEYHLAIKKLKPYVAFEFMYASSYNDGTLLTSCYLDPRCDPMPFNSSATTLGFNPTIGASYQLNKCFSVRLETSATIGANQFVTLPIYGSTTYYSDVEGVFIFNPISSLSLNFHF